VRWFGECRLERFRVNEQRLQRLAEYSRVVLGEWRNRHSLAYEQSQGWLRLFRNDTDLGRARLSIDLLTQAGTPHRLLDGDACRAVEPALADTTPLAGGLHFTEDETGNCAYFARLVRDLAVALGVDFRFEAAASALATAGGKCTGARTAVGAVAADAVVVAAGVDSARLLRGTGIRLPLCPVKGYSLTANITQHECAPSMSIMDEASQVTITRLGNRLRIAGFSELGNRSSGLRDRALGALLGAARDWFPAAAAYGKARAWAGVGAMLPDGPPVLGATPVSNLYLNIGHGSTGWAMACGAARVVADIVTGRPPQIDLDGLTIARYQHRREA
jgi:D-amino-acid dehydrogenase